MFFAFAFSYKKVSVNLMLSIGQLNEYKYIRFEEQLKKFRKLKWMETSKFLIS